jgi:two-component system sensor histidine kinase PilS (NtrC family)
MDETSPPLRTSERRRGGPAQGEIHQQLVWFAGLRLVVVTTFLLTTLLFDFVIRVRLADASLIQVVRTGPLYVILAGAYVLGFANLGLASLVRSPVILAAVQFGGDIVLETALLHVMGYEGPVAAALAFYFLTTFLACSYLTRTQGALFATGAFLLQAAVQVPTHLGALSYEPLVGADPQPVLGLQQLLFNLSAFMFTFYGTAWLVSSRTERLRAMRDNLQEVTGNLEELQALHEQVIRSMTAGLVTADDAGGITFMNASAARLLGAELARARGRSLHDLLGWAELRPGDLEIAVQGRRSLRLAREANLAGRRASLEVEVSRMLGADHPGWLFLLEDVTELRELEAEVRLKERMAAIGEMAAGIAHEIRNPLASISGSVQMLEKSLDLPGEQGRLMRIVLKESSRLDKTIREFLDFARPREARPRTIDLTEIARETIQLLQNSAEVGARHELRPPTRTPVLAHADPDQVRQVAWNLCRNALKAMPEGGSLEVSVHGEGGEAVLTVADTGVGMSAAMRARAFQPLVSEFPGGMGLGLAIVYRIVKDHGGRISIDSAPGRGTRVEVRLPQPVGAAQPAEALQGEGR